MFILSISCQAATLLIVKSENSLPYLIRVLSLHYFRVVQNIITSNSFGSTEAFALSLQIKLTPNKIFHYRNI